MGVWASIDWPCSITEFSSILTSRGCSSLLKSMLLFMMKLDLTKKRKYLASLPMDCFRCNSCQTDHNYWQQTHDSIRKLNSSEQQCHASRDIARKAGPTTIVPSTLWSRKCLESDLPFHELWRCLECLKFLSESCLAHRSTNFASIHTQGLCSDLTRCTHSYRVFINRASAQIWLQRSTPTSQQLQSPDMLVDLLVASGLVPGHQSSQSTRRQHPHVRKDWIITSVHHFRNHEHFTISLCSSYTPRKQSCRRHLASQVRL